MMTRASRPAHVAIEPHWGATAQFKYRPVTRTGEGNWSDPVSLLVH
jgi:hypothetical protein